MFSLDKSGVPSKFKKETNTLSHQIVEECMLMANKITANELNNKAINSIFRNHKEPSHNQVSKLLEMINALGIKKNFNQDNFSSQNLNIFIKSIKNSDKSIIAKYIILRSFKKAHYNSKNEGHFGLGFENYTHFTSPIRRYSDLMIHRLLKNQLFKETIKIKPEIITIVIATVNMRRVRRLAGSDGECSATWRRDSSRAACRGGERGELRRRGDRDGLPCVALQPRGALARACACACAPHDRGA